MADQDILSFLQSEGHRPQAEGWDAEPKNAPRFNALGNLAYEYQEEVAARVPKNDLERMRNLNMGISTFMGPVANAHPELAGTMFRSPKLEEVKSPTTMLIPSDKALDNFTLSLVDSANATEEEMDKLITPQKPNAALAKAMFGFHIVSGKTPDEILSGKEATIGVDGFSIVGKQGKDGAAPTVSLVEKFTNKKTQVASAKVRAVKSSPDGKFHLMVIGAPLVQSSAKVTELKTLAAKAKAEKPKQAKSKIVPLIEDEF